MHNSLHNTRKEANMKKLSLILALALILTLPGCGKRESLDPTDSIRIIKTGDGFAVTRSKNELTCGDIADNAAKLLAEYVPELSDFTFDGYFEKSAASIPAYGDLIPGQPINDTESALFSGSEVRDEFAMQEPAVALIYDDYQTSVSGSYLGLPFKLSLRYSDAAKELVTNADGSVSDAASDNPVTLSSVSILFNTDAIKGREVELFISMRDRLAKLFGAAENFEDMRHNPYVDCTLEEMPPLDELPEYIAVNWPNGSGDLTLQLTHREAFDTLYANLTISIV